MKIVLQTIWLRAVQRPLFLLAVLGTAGLFALSQTSLWTAPSKTDPVHLADQRVRLVGVAVTPGEPTARGRVSVVRCETLSLSGRTVSATGLVRLHIATSRPLALEPGDRIQAWGSLMVPPHDRIPGTFDYADYLQKRGVHTVFYAGAGSVQILGVSGEARAVRLGWRLNHALIRAWERRLPPEEAAVISGLVCGQRPRLFPEVQRAFVESGTMHVLVASGANVAFVLGAWFLFMRMVLSLRRSTALMTGLIPVWIYALTVGGDAPILRAALMATLMIMADSLSRDPDPLHNWALAGFGLLLIAPRWITDLGFQMSFVTVFGFLVTPTPGFLNNERRPAWVRWTLRIVFASLVAQLWVFPFSAAVFKRFFPIGILANIVIVPLSAGGFVAGVTVLLVDAWNKGTSVDPWGAGALIQAVRLYAKTLFECARFFADHPGTTLWLRSPDPAWIAGYYGLLGFAPRRQRGAVWMGLILVSGALLLWGRGPFPRSSAKTAPQWTWIDVGRSSAVLLESPRGVRALALNAPEPDGDAWERTLLPFLSESGIRRLALVVSPKPLPPDLLARIRRGLKIDSVATSGRWLHKDVEIVVIEKEDSYTDQNPILMKNGTGKVLLTKGVGLKTQRALMKALQEPVNVLQGSFQRRTKWDPNFVRAMNPEWVVENGHPSIERPALVPWSDSHLARPQTEGVWTWPRINGAANPGGKS